MKKANKQKRIAAFGIDFLIASIFQAAILMPAMIYGAKNQNPSFIISANFIGTGICFIYFLLKDISGQSIGKRILKLKIQTAMEARIYRK